MQVALRIPREFALSGDREVGGIFYKEYNNSSDSNNNNNGARERARARAQNAVCALSARRAISAGVEPNGTGFVRRDTVETSR